MTLSTHQIHPSLWRATQLAGSQSPCHASGHAPLDAELPGGGWPTGSLTEICTPHPGVEIRLLAPVLAKLAPHRPIVLLAPPHTPNSVCCVPTHGATPARSWLWLAPERPLDAMWAAEQVLKNGSCAALLYWQADIRPAALRRLHLAAQSSDMLFFMIRPTRAAQSSSPAPLRLQVQPAAAGLSIDIFKRRGPALGRSLFVDLPTPAPHATPHLTPHAPLDRPTPAPARAGRTASVLAA